MSQPEIAAFVAGATGYTGRSLVKVLRDRGQRVIAHVRPDSPELSRWTETFESMGASLDTTAWELEPLARAMAEHAPTHVFALIGTTRRRAGRAGLSAAQAYDRVDRGLTVMLVDAAAAVASPPRFVYLSAVGVTPDARNAYYRARADAEAHVMLSGLPYTIVRPSFIVGPDRDEHRAGEQIGAAVADAGLGLVGWLGGRRLRDRYKSISGPQLASELVRLGLDPQYENTIVEAESLQR